MNYPAIPREFFNGDCFDAYRFLGVYFADGGAGGWFFRVWAPGALAVQVCGDFNAWKGEDMAFTPGGVWNLHIPAAREG